jgi:hypothetical protein
MAKLNFVQVKKFTPPPPSPNRPALGTWNCTPPPGHVNGNGPNIYHGGVVNGATDGDLETPAPPITSNNPQGVV